MVRCLHHNRSRMAQAGTLTSLLQRIGPNHLQTFEQALKRLGIDAAPLEAEPAPPNERLENLGRLHAKLRLEINRETDRVVESRRLKHSTFSREQFKLEPNPLRFRVTDDISTQARFNDEKSWVELQLTRGFPLASINKSTSVHGLMKGVHSDWVYSRFEAANDGILDVKVEEFEGEVRNRLRIRTMRNVGFDSHWHTLKINENFRSRH